MRSDLGIERHIYGPPGCGKTTQLGKWILQTIQRHGVDSMMVASFTRAAAATIAGREVGAMLPAGAIGTLHSFAYRALGTPQLATSSEVLKQWNSSPEGARWPISQSTDDADDLNIEFVGGESDGDKAMSETQILRAQMVPVERWPTLYQDFHRAWQAFKEDTGTIDFTDMIALALEHTSAPLNAPRIGFFDEVQDFTPLELALVRHWGKGMENYVLAGDDDQSIYYFKGASPDAFMNVDVPDERKTFLRQSYRVPRAVVDYASEWVLGVDRRVEKMYRPRERGGAVVDGEVKQTNCYWEDAPTIYRTLEEYLKQTTTTDDGKERPKTVMVLGTCSYMLEPLKRFMRANAVPFHNPYRRKRGDWNPLNVSKGVGAVGRLLAFLAPSTRLEHTAFAWTGEELKLWAEMVLAKGTFVHGAKARIKMLDSKQLIPLANLEAYFEDGVLEQAIYHARTGNPIWLMGRLEAARKRQMEYVSAVYRKHGREALTKTPQITLGTIHSVKGGESDVVLVFPDLSWRAYDQGWMGSREAHDAIVRTMYVGFTRAYETLLLGWSGSDSALTLPRP